MTHSTGDLERNYGVGDFRRMGIKDHPRTDILSFTFLSELKVILSLVALKSIPIVLEHFVVMYLCFVIISYTLNFLLFRHPRIHFCDKSTKIGLIPYFI